MKKLVFAILFSFITIYSFSQVPTAQKLDPGMALKNADSNGIVWLDPKKAPFDLIGFEWIDQDHIYKRLPVHPDWELRKPVDALANHTAGGQVRFSTNSKRILIRVELREKSGMYHMSATGQSGFDLYVKKGDIQRYLKTASFKQDTIRYEAELLNTEKQQLCTYTLNFPLYNGVNSLMIGIEKGSAIEAPPAFSLPGKIVIYGTSTTQGGCVSRPGMLYSNLLSRWMDIQFVNLGFSGNGKGEPELAHLINQISNTRMIILDYEANAAKTIVNTLGPFVEILREKHPDTPILIMSKFHSAYFHEETASWELWNRNREFQKKLVKERKAAGDQHIYFLDGSKLFGEDFYECTVDGGHPTDLGAYRVAKGMLPVIRQILLEQD